MEYTIKVTNKLLSNKSVVQIVNKYKSDEKFEKLFR